MSDQYQQEEHLHNEKFQRERIALFSDAVFAIAITLLIIEIRPPEAHGIFSDIGLLNRVLMNLPRFSGFLISFWVIGLYWMAHHRLFRYVVHSNQKLLGNNLLFLLPIVTIPQSTAFLTDFWLTSLHMPLIIYTLNIVVAGLLSYRLWKVVANPKNGISRGMDELVVRYNLTRALFTPAMFVLLLLLSYISFWFVWIIPSLIPIAIMFVKRYYRNKYPKLWVHHNF